MLRMLGIGQCFHHILIAEKAAAILERAGPFASQADRIGFARFRVDYVFHHNLMNPIVAKVVLVEEDNREQA